MRHLLVSNILCGVREGKLKAARKGEINVGMAFAHMELTKSAVREEAAKRERD
jgi:hypothetical protein